MSECRGCITSGIARSMLRYQPMPRGDSVGISYLQDYITTLAMASGLLHASACNKVRPRGESVRWRVYCELHPNLPRPGKRRLHARIERPLEVNRTDFPGGSFT